MNDQRLLADLAARDHVLLMIAGHFLRLGKAAKEKSQWRESVDRHRTAAFAACLYNELAATQQDYESRCAETWNHLDAFARAYQRMLTKTRSPHVDDDAEARADIFGKAACVVAALESASTKGYEAVGDALAPSNPRAARWFYGVELQERCKYLGSAGSGGLGVILDLQLEALNAKRDAIQK